MENNSCPCQSGQTFRDCCGIYINDGEQAATAEMLMRSRYTAYTLHDEAYLLKTWHISTRPLTLELDKDMPSDWRGLEIVRKSEGGEKDEKGVVEFIARFDANGKAGQVHEISKFIKEDGVWYFLDDDAPEKTPARSEKIGRNLPCPCGSGKKYKRCCGA